jgi:hypothetical protein
VTPPTTALTKKNPIRIMLPVLREDELLLELLLELLSSLLSIAGVLPILILVVGLLTAVLLAGAVDTAWAGALRLMTPPIVRVPIVIVAIAAVQQVVVNECFFMGLMR